MNYSTLFPKILNNLPKYNYDDLTYQYNGQNKEKRTNPRMNIYIPQGRKCFLWFLKYDNKDYSLIIEFDKGKVHSNKTRFRYMSFREELTKNSGTLLYGTYINNEFCAEKIIYYMGEKYNKKDIMTHMNMLKNIIETKTKRLNSDEFMNICLPFMNCSYNFLFDATNLAYPVYEIKHCDNRTHKLHNYTATFQIKCDNEYRDIYDLYYYSNNGNKKYDTAYVNDFKMSNIIRKKFNKKLKNYVEIEYSDDESEDDDENKSIETEEKVFYIKCVYVHHNRKWKPYKFVNGNYVDPYDKIKEIENKKY